MNVVPVEGWDALTEECIEHLRANPLPLEGLPIGPGRQIENAGLYRDALLAECTLGPTGPRAQYGALQKDLFDLRAAFLFNSFSTRIDEAEDAEALTLVGKELPFVRPQLNPVQWDSLRERGQARRAILGATSSEVVESV